MSWEAKFLFRVTTIGMLAIVSQTSAWAGFWDWLKPSKPSPHMPHSAEGKECRAQPVTWHHDAEKKRYWQEVPVCPAYWEPERLYGRGQLYAAHAYYLKAHGKDRKIDGCSIDDVRFRRYFKDGRQEEIVNKAYEDLVHEILFTVTDQNGKVHRFVLPFVDRKNPQVGAASRSGDHYKSEYIFKDGRKFFFRYERDDERDDWRVVKFQFQNGQGKVVSCQEKKEIPQSSLQEPSQENWDHAPNPSAD